MASEDKAGETESPTERQRRERQPSDRRHAPAEEESIPVFGGRLLIAAAMLAVMVVIPMSEIGKFLDPKQTIAPTSAWAMGQTATVAITLITADYNKLACASDKEFEGMHCQFKTEKEPWPRAADQALDDNKANIIQPYRTADDNKLIMVAGLWAQPEVAMRLHSEPSLGVAEEKLARFIAQCDVKFIGTQPGMKLRWNSSGSWGAPDISEPFVAKPVSCKVTNPP